MAMVVISVIIGHCTAGQIDTPDTKMQELVCTAIVGALRQCLKILPERMELFAKGLVSCLSVNPTRGFRTNGLEIGFISGRNSCGFCIHC